MYTDRITISSTAQVSHLQNGNELSGKDEPAVRTLTGPAHWELFKYITRVSGLALSDEEKTILAGCVKFKKLRKRQYFLQEGDVCRYTGFIIKGSTRMFSINDRGQESIVAFGLEHSWVGDQQSFKAGTASLYHIEAMENTELLIMKNTQMEFLISTVPAVAMMFSNYQIQQLIYNQNRINAALSMTIQERYYNLMKSCPSYAQRFSQHMIACYLGVKAETLCRIRKSKI
ncbi:MAG: Crp/Fnr family transcriptional regulator [Sphingobacteriales bacterium]|nr:MAG: Crp/Fnr family transcriptional regulator [Sphingobacteriales bacterium]